MAQRVSSPLTKTVLFTTPLCVLAIAYYFWSPGMIVRDGRHDLRKNGIWIQHGWLGDDSWFFLNGKDKSLFRNEHRIRKLSDLLSNHGIIFVFPHLCPSSPDGRIAPVEPLQTEKLLDHFQKFSIVPWIGGVMGIHCSPQSSQWRANFIASAVDLLESHPRLAGVQVNIEPMPTGNAHFLKLLEELRQAMPKGKILSVAAYPPPTLWHPFPEVHWKESYFRQVVQRVDQIVPMMYDTSIKLSKPYRHLMSCWTSDILRWAGGTEVLLGIPVYDDSGVGYHSPEVENLHNALLGIHAGLSRHKILPENYAGVAIYCEWEMDQQEWAYFKKEFEKEE